MHMHFNLNFVFDFLFDLYIDFVEKKYSRSLKVIINSTNQSLRFSNSLSSSAM